MAKASSAVYKSYAGAVKAKITATALDALELGANTLIYEPSQAIVPLDEGPLQDSGAVIREGKTIYVSYGTGESAAYAVIQHENLNYAHPNGRQAKYLETPFRQNQEQLISLVRGAIKANV